MGEWVRRPSGFEDPFCRVRDHSDNRGQDGVVGLVDRPAFFFRQVAAFHRKFEPDLRFRGFGFRIGELADKRCFVAALAPCLGDIRADAS